MSETSIPFVLGEEPARAKRDGCGCPEWVERCIHFDDKVLRLLADPQAARCGCAIATCRYVVCTGNFRPCHVDGSLTHVLAFERLYLGDDYDEALAAFHEAEERLLRGEPS